MHKLQISITFLVLVLLSGTAASADWPMFRHDPAHSGVADEVVEPLLMLLWKYKIADTSAVMSSPVVSGSIVYVGSQEGDNLYAFDAATGSLRWKYNTNVIISSPAVSNDIVYVASYDGLYALDAATGALKWNYTTVKLAQSSPAVSNGVVYVGSNDNNVYAFDAATGDLKWTYNTGYRVRSSPAVSSNTVYVGGAYLYALNATTGTLKWRYYVQGCADSSPTVFGDEVYVASSFGYIYALDAATGNLKWECKLGGNFYSSPAVSNGVVYIGNYYLGNKNVYALDAGTGNLKWKYTTGSDVLSSPAVSDSVVYIGSNDNNLYALDAATGALKWKYTTGGSVRTSPAVSGGMVYVCSDDGNVYAFAPATTTPTPTPASTPTGMPTTTSTSTPPSPTSTSTPLPTAILDPTFIPTPIPTPKDTSSPAISILNPTIIEYNNNGVLEEGEKVEITYGAMDTSGVASIRILLDGAMLESRNQAGTYTVTTNSLSVGRHTIRVEAADSKSNSCFEELPLTVERTGPSVYFGTTRTSIKKGEDAIFTLSAVNPIGNPPMTVQLILKPPSGVSVTSSSFAKAGSGIYTCTQAIESGDNVRSIEVRLTGNQEKTHEIASEVYYQFEGSPKSPTRYETLTFAVESNHISTDSESEDQDNELPGFEAVFAVIGLLAVYLRRKV